MICFICLLGLDTSSGEQRRVVDCPIELEPAPLEIKDLPLEPGRTIPIDLDEGSWMSLDVSPDGRTIVFDYLGDLFTMPTDGGRAEQLTSGMAFDAQPRFSPDGSQVVFTSDRSGGQNIWVINLDGSDTIQVSRGAANRAEQPEWTPDGKYIIASMGMGNFRFGGSPTLRIFHIDGGGGAELLDQGPKRLGAAVSPDGAVNLQPGSVAPGPDDSVIALVSGDDDDTRPR